MQMNAQIDLFVGEKSSIFNTICWEDTLEKLTKSNLIFWSSVVDV